MNKSQNRGGQHGRQNPKENQAASPKAKAETATPLYAKALAAGANPEKDAEIARLGRCALVHSERIGFYLSRVEFPTTLNGQPVPFGEFMSFVPVDAERFPAVFRLEKPVEHFERLTRAQAVQWCIEHLLPECFQSEVKPAAAV